MKSIRHFAFCFTSATKEWFFEYLSTLSDLKSVRIIMPDVHNNHNYDLDEFQLVWLYATTQARIVIEVPSSRSHPHASSSIQHVHNIAEQTMVTLASLSLSPPLLSDHIRVVQRRPDDGIPHDDDDDIS